MVESPSLLLAFAAGIVSFVSPCCLPLVPGYLAAVSGTTPADSGRFRLDLRVLGRSLMFVATFSLIFILLGLSATAAGSFLFANKPLLNTISGVAIIAMGVLFVASVFVLRLNQEFRPHGLIERAGKGGPVVAGAAFAIAWTPCVRPNARGDPRVGRDRERNWQGAPAARVLLGRPGAAVPVLLGRVQRRDARVRVLQAPLRGDPDRLGDRPGGDGISRL